MSTRLSLESTRINWSALDVEPPRDFSITPDAIPGRKLWNIRSRPDGRRELVSLKWGLVPGWLKDFSQAPANARIETAAQNPVFRSAWRGRRCVILADSFCLWQLTEHDQNVLWSVRSSSRRLMLFAGLWERYSIDDNIFFDSCAVLTMPSVTALRSLSPRMPAALPEKALSRWLAGDQITPDDWDRLTGNLTFHCQHYSALSRSGR